MHGWPARRLAPGETSAQKAKCRLAACGVALMFTQSIKRKIVGIAIGLIILMIITSVLSMLMASTVRHLLDELNAKYIPRLWRFGPRECSVA
jgi:hypothetical protein